MVTFGSRLELPTLRHKLERIQTSETPQSAFSKIQKEFSNAFLLESARGEKRLAEYSFIGFGPAALFSVKDRTLLVRTEENGHEKRRTSDPLSELRRMVGNRIPAGQLRFVGGAVGYISYDAIRYWERLPATARDELELPDMEFGIFPDCVAFDHMNGKVYYMTVGENRLSEVKGALESRNDEASIEHSRPKRSLKKEEFEEKVETAKEYVRQGDIFQVVLSVRNDFEVEGDLTAFYTALSEINPSPYMYFLKFGERRIVGSSPEMLVRVENRKVETYPIAGTRPHVADAAVNRKLTKELLSDPKEKAEHVMLVDLARNDVGRVSRYGTVEVPEFLTVQQFSHVQHIVSHVVGDLREGVDEYDTLRALFPAGTVSGAPKVRAMEIIEELEQVRRGPYAGCVGYFSFNGNADFAITIRTLVAERNRCHVQAGAGIVAGSVPEKEWAEAESKSAGLLRAIQVASGEKR